MKKKSSSRKRSLAIECKEAFVGDRTIFSLLGYVVGGILVGEILRKYGEIYLGMPGTILIGIIIFAVSGTMSRRFEK